MTLSERPAAAHRPRNPDAPEVTVAPTISASAGKPAAVPVRVVHRGRAPARIRVTIFGLDARWAPAPLDLGILQPGDSAAITLTILPERGALGASYPFTIAAESSSAAASLGASGRARPVVGVAEATLVLDAAERVSMSLLPSTPTAVFSRAIRVNITNPSGTERTFTLAPEAAAGARLRLRHKAVTVPPQQTVTVPGRVRVRKPTIFGGDNTHTFSVKAQGSGAPEWVEGTLRSTAFVGKGLRTVIGLILVVALWAALAVVFIPKISDAFKKNDAATSVSTADGGTAGAEGAGSGSDGGASGASGADGAGAGGAGAGGGADGAGGPGAGSYVVSGTVTGPGAVGASATLTPVSLASAGDDDSLPVVQPGPGTSPKALRGGASAFVDGVMPAAANTDDGTLGKIPGPIAAVPRVGFRATTVLTTDKGEFTIPGVVAPGYYLLVLAKAGFQTQRFLINSANLAAPQPMKVELVPGAGRLSGTVTGPAGAVGAATIVVTDGTVTLQTSSVSASTNTGTPGTWLLDQVSTPGTYLVTASAPGLGSASTLVTLDASGSAQVDLRLVPGQGSIVGKVSGEDSLGAVGGLGGITVTAKGGDTTRTATTVTSAAMRGAFVLPNLPAPGDYTLTISGDGFQTQTRTVSLGASGGSVTVNATLSRADSVVAGMVTGLDANGKAEGGLGGVGLTLASNDVTMKTMTTSGDSAGSYQFTGVAPGSYVLTAVQFGRVAASATVELAASTSQTVNLVLKADIGAELPATAHIRGQVVDSRSGGPLTCDRAVPPLSDAADCVATVTVTAPKDPADSSKGTVTYTSTATAALNYVYTIPDINDPDHAGLPPGLYTVTVTAPGYEDTVTHVQVAQGQTVPAPAATMPPLGIISGTISTRVGTPDKTTPTCVLAVPASVTLPALDSLPKKCAQSPDDNTCTVQGIPGAQPCAIASTGEAGQAPLGTYTIRGLTHGQYRMVLIAQDLEYVYTVGTVPIVTLDVGADGQFNATLDRLGRINLTIQKINPSTGQLEPETGATLTLAPTGGSPIEMHILAGGTPENPMITRLQAGAYDITAKADITPVGSTTAQTVEVLGTSGVTALNQTVDMTLIVALRTEAIVGRITTAVDNNTTIGVPGVTVAISGTVVSASGTSDAGKGSVITDANGCYAIVKSGWDDANDSQLTSGACPDAVASGSIATMLNGTQPATLISDSIQITVAALTKSGSTITNARATANAVVKDCPAPGGTSLCGDSKVRILDTISVDAEPMKVEPTLDVVGPDDGFGLPSFPSQVHLSVVSKPTAAGTVTLVPETGAPWSPLPLCTNSSGGGLGIAAADCWRVPLTFKDSTLGGENTVRPGLYQFSVGVDGFVPITIYLRCEFLQAGCVFAADPAGTAIRLAVMRRPALNADISLTTPGNLAPTVWADAWKDATALQTPGSTSLGAIKVVGDSPSTVDADDGSGGTVTTVTAINAHLEFGNPASRTILAPNSGDYEIELSRVQGFQSPITLSASCPSEDFTQPCTASVGPADPYPTFDSAGSVMTLSDTAAPDGTPFELDDITATVSPASPRLTVKVGSDGHITWDDDTEGLLEDQNQAIPGTYTVTFHLPGFTDVPVTVTCPTTGTCSTVNETLQRLPEASGTIEIPLAPGATSVTVPANAVTVSPSTPSLKVSLENQEDGAGNPTTTWNLVFNDSSVGVPGLVLAKDYSLNIDVPGYESLTVTCSAASATSCTVTGAMELNPTPAMQLTILPANDTVAAPSVTVDSGTSGITLTSDRDGTLTWKQAGPDGVVTPRSTAYVIRAQLSGYEMSVDGNAVTSVDFTCAVGGSCDFPDIVLTKKTDLVVKLVDSSDSVITANARVSLNGTSSPVTTDGSTAFNGRSTTGVKETSGVWSDGTYTLTVHAAGYRFVTSLDSDATTVSCTNGTDIVDGVHLFPGGTTTCTVTLTALGAISGTTVWDAAPLSGSTAPALTALSNVPLTASKGSGSDTVTVTTTAGSGTDGNGFTLTGTVSTSSTVDIEGLTAGDWAISASPTGYFPLSGTVTIGCVSGSADADGFCDNGFEISAVSPSVASPTSSYLTLSGQQVTIHFVPTQVDFTVRFTNGGVVADLPPGTVTLTSSVGGAWTCAMPPATPGSECTIATDSESLTFNDVPPGAYTLGVDFSGSHYSDIVGQSVTIAPSGVAQSKSLPITARITTVTGFVKDSAGTVIPNAHVNLCDTSGCPAKDFDDDSMDEVKTGSDGKFTFSNVADGTYHFVVTADGYADNTTGNFTVNFDTGLPVQNVTLVAPTRQTLSMTFTAPAGLTLAGASVTLTQTSNGGRLAIDGPLTASTISGTGLSGSPYTSTLPGPPTGEYDVFVLMGSASAPFAFPAGSVTVSTGIDTQNESLTVQATAVTLTVETSDTNQVIPAGVPVTVTQHEPSTSHDVQLAVDTSDSLSAGADLYLPPGTFDWEPTLSGTTWEGWSGTKSTVTVPANGGAATGDLIAELTAPTPTVKVTVTNGGAALGDDESVHVNFLSIGTETCAAATDTSGVIACTGLTTSTTYGVTATWTNEDDGDTVYAGYGTVTTDNIGNGSITIGLVATPSALVTITDGGTPATGATVKVYDNDGNPVNASTAYSTDAVGNVFVTGLTAGQNYYAFASKDMKKTSRITIAATTNGLDTASGQLEATVSLTVTVTDATSHAVISGATVSIVMNGLDAIQLGSGTTSTTDGTYKLSGLPADEKVNIAVSHTDYDDKTATGVSLGSSDSSTSVILTPAPPPAPTTVSADLVLTTSDSSAIAQGTTVQLLDATPSVIATATTTDANGAVAFTGLDPGTNYTVSITGYTGTLTTGTVNKSYSVTLAQNP